MPTKRVVVVLAACVGIVGCAGLAAAALALRAALDPMRTLVAFSELRLPPDARLVDHSDNAESMITATLQIPIARVPGLIQENELNGAPWGDSTGPVSGVIVRSRCLHDGNHRTDLTLDIGTGRLELRIGYPDMSGDKPCLD